MMAKKVTLLLTLLIMVVSIVFGASEREKTSSRTPVKLLESSPLGGEEGRTLGGFKPYLTWRLENPPAQFVVYDSRRHPLVIEKVYVGEEEKFRIPSGVVLFPRFTFVKGDNEYVIDKVNGKFRAPKGSFLFKSIEDSLKAQDAKSGKAPREVTEEDIHEALCVLLGLTLDMTEGDIKTRLQKKFKVKEVQQEVSWEENKNKKQSLEEQHDQICRVFGINTQQGNAKILEQLQKSYQVNYMPTPFMRWTQRLSD